MTRDSLDAQVCAIASVLWKLDDGDEVNLPGKVKVLDHKSEMDSYGESTELTLIVDVDGQLFRINGTQDSYGDDLRFYDAKPVTARTKTVTVYE